MEEKTVVIGFNRVSWRIYRVETQSSVYTLGLYEGDGGRRPCAVLRGISQGKLIDAQDSAPLVGNTSLFTVAPSDWVGQSLEIGTVKTSSVRRVEVEDDEEKIRAVTERRDLTVVGSTEHVRKERKNASEEPHRTWSAYPTDRVEYVESAANLLRAVYGRHDLVADLRENADLMRRFQVAVGECFLMSKALASRLSGG
jgi:hypothetical protein